MDESDFAGGEWNHGRRENSGVNCYWLNPVDGVSGDIEHPCATRPHEKTPSIVGGFGYQRVSIIVLVLVYPKGAAPIFKSLIDRAVHVGACD